VQPGTEGVASLVFDVPRNARSVKGGPRDGDGQQGTVTDCLFEVRCTLGIKIGLPLGRFVNMTDSLLNAIFNATV
jgi:hypothetical protein